MITSPFFSSGFSAFAMQKPPMTSASGHTIFLIHSIILFQNRQSLGIKTVIYSDFLLTFEYPFSVACGNYSNHCGIYKISVDNHKNNVVMHDFQMHR